MIVTLLPLLHLKIETLPIIWPPVGSIVEFAAAYATLIIGASGAFPELIRNKKVAKRYATASLALAIVAFFAYVFLLAAYVPRVLTRQHGAQYRAIGTKETADAERLFPNMPPAEILEKAGLNDDDIERMWVRSSVIHVRIGLFLVYTLCLCSLNFYIGSQARAVGFSRR